MNEVIIYFFMDNCRYRNTFIEIETFP